MTKQLKHDGIQESKSILYSLIFPTFMSMIIVQHYIVKYNNSKAAKSYEIFQPTGTLFMIHVAKPNWLRNMKLFFYAKEFQIQLSLFNAHLENDDLAND